MTEDHPAWRLPQSRAWTASDFRFRDGRSLASMRLGYTVLGNPAGAPVLILHGTGGSGAALLNDDFGGELFGPGQPLDAARHFIVLPDAIGHGGSAKPSDGLGMDFPRYVYDDMVEAQHRLVTEALGLRHLRLVLGTSMGGMHAWLWGIAHPGFMDALMPLSCLPAPMSGRNWMMRRLAIDLIRHDPHWSQGRYVEQPAVARVASELFAIATNGGTRALQAVAPTREAADRWLEARRAQPFTTDANDLLYQWESARDYDPTPGLSRIRAPVLAINSDDDERNPPETGIAQRAIEALPDARLRLLAGSEATRGHGTVGLARLWAEDCRAFLASVPAR